MSDDKPLAEIKEEADTVSEDAPVASGDGLAIFSLRYGALLGLVMILFIIATSTMFIESVLKPIAGTVDASGHVQLKGKFVQAACLALGLALLDGALRMGVL